MNKIMEFFKKIFSAIYKFIDKILITPLSRLVYHIGKLLKRNGNKLDGILNKPKYLIIFSLLIAVAAFLLVDSKAVTLVENESEILSDQAITVIYNEEKYVVEGVPETVDIILIGKKSDLYLAKQLGDHEVVLDLSDYKEGEYTVKLKYNHSIESITYKLDPSTVTVKISEKVSAVKTLSYDLLNQDDLDSKLNISGVELNESEVYVKGSEETLSRVAIVKALIDVNTLNITEAGTHQIDSIPMVAYDENGEIVDNVEIVPSTASATITVDSYYTDLPVKVVPTGSLATGYALESATSSVMSVRVYGDEESISKLSYISAEIDVEGLSSDKTYSVTLTKPSGVRYMSDTTATIEAKIGKEETKEVTVSSIEIRNLGSSYAATSTDEANTSVAIIVKGVSSVLSNINDTNITAYVDLSGYTTGTYDVPIEVEGSELLASYTPKVTTIEIKITNRSS